MISALIEADARPRLLYNLLRLLGYNTHGQCSEYFCAKRFRLSLFTLNFYISYVVLFCSCFCASTAAVVTLRLMEEKVKGSASESVF